MEQDPALNQATRLPALDGLRGFAVLLVVGSHAGHLGTLLVPGLDLRGTGRMGVFLFFALSSFLLTHLALMEPPGRLRSGSYWWGYAKRRVLRVMPAYLVVLVFYGIEVGWDLPRALEHVVLVRGERHFWTVSVEMRWYLVLPLATGVLVLARAKPWIGPTILVLAAVGLRLVAPPDYGGIPPQYRVPFLPFVPVFLLGCLAAWIYHRQNLLRAGEPGRGSALWEVAGWAGLAGLLAHFPTLRQALSGEVVEHTRYHLYFDRIGALCALLILGVLLGSGGLRKVFAWGPLRFIGRVSFSLYLMHPMVLSFLYRHGSNWPSPVPSLVFCGGSLALAWILWRWVEVPCVKLARLGSPLASTHANATQEGNQA